MKISEINERVVVSLGSISLTELKEALNHYPFVELRLDLLPDTCQLVELIKASKKPKLIASFRPKKNVSDADRSVALKSLIDTGIEYLDLEIEAPDDYFNELSIYSKRHDTKLIVSFHDFDKTPDTSELLQVIDEARNKGADIVKIATRVISSTDNLRLISLLDETKSMVVIGMGEEGKVSRVAAALLGAEFTFAAPDKGPETAPGQLSYSELTNILKQL